MSASEMTPQRGRREFLRAVGLAGLASALPAGVWAQSATPPSSTPPSTPSSSSPPAAAGAAGAAPPPEISEDARTLAEIVRRRYGKHLTPDQLEGVTSELDQRIQGGRALRDAKLANGDEPDFTFHP